MISQFVLGSIIPSLYGYVIFTLLVWLYGLFVPSIKHGDPARQCDHCRLQRIWEYRCQIG
jgi:hypothetical protein